MSQSHYSAKVVANGLARMKEQLSVWQEKATTLVSGRAKTTSYLPGAEESAEAWALIDPLDAIAVNDPVALVQMGGKPVTLGKIVRGALGMARIGRQIALTGPAATISPLPAAGTGAATTGSEGNDSAGFIKLTTGTAPAAGSIVRISFATARPNDKYNLILTPRTQNARSLGGVVGQTNTALGNVDIDCRATLAAATEYQWGYEIKGYA